MLSVKQLAVLQDTLAAFTAFTHPGMSTELPQRWEAAAVMWRGKPLPEGSYS